MDSFILYFIKSVFLGIFLMEMPEVKTTRKWVDVGQNKRRGRKLSSLLSSNNIINK